MFANAKKVAVSPVAKAAKPAKATDAVAGWEELAALDATSKALSSLVDFRKTTMRDAVNVTLIERGLRMGDKPGSLAPVEGEAKGSAYVSKRSTASALAQEEVELIAEATGAEVTLDDAGGILSVAGYVDVVEASPALLAVNPAYANDPVLLAKIDAALSGIKGIPEDFIVQIAPVQKRVVSDAALGNLFRLGSEAVEALLPVLSITALRPVFAGSLERAWELIKPLIPSAVAAMEKAPSAKAAKAATNAPSFATQLKRSAAKA